MEMETYGAISVLPFELQVEILSRLPVKTLMRFKCVSKPWKSVIADDKPFTKLHLARSSQNAHLLLTLECITDGEEVTHIAITPVHRLLEDPSPRIFDGQETLKDRLNNHYSVAGSYNGIVCLRGYLLTASSVQVFWFLLWNPVTRLRSEYSPVFKESRLQGKTNYGFGYDDSRATFKVVVAIWTDLKMEREVWVSCMGDTCWRKILIHPAFPTLLSQIDGQFVGGCVNWLALDNLNGPFYDWNSVTLNQLVIVSFDMRQEEAYTYLSLPQGLREVPCVEPQLGILRNHLCLFHYHKTTHFVVWQMTKYGVPESWTQLVCFSYAHPRSDYNLLPLCLSEDGNILLLANNHALKVMVHNLRDNSVEYIDQLTNNKVWLNAHGYVESLVSPF
ncbi:F-box/kelch-repeat protein At3g23880-like [Lotus japonicus]|uniref:F-box/kelch-repeat protein At3g23880-like n=1 Tax=Lotus japonicus TaxID=34305 RepID=UPI002585679F|nr:F-box/kelch-repeat protein At3g23880-like [Lotus japonicus]